MAKVRLDQALVDRGLAPSRARARDAILRGMVQVAGNVVNKPARKTGPDEPVALNDPASGYVSRAALKLIHALDHFHLDPQGQTCVDIGASTGGFCQVLLERGAHHVYGVDVGHGQMHETLHGHPALSVLEGVNARYLDRTHIPNPFSVLVSDVSFISLKLALPTALDMAEPGAFAALLVKPQFEVGKENIGKGGLVRDGALGERVAREMFQWLDGQAVNADGPAAPKGWRCLDLVPSPITGGDGNIEYLLVAVKDR